MSNSTEMSPSFAHTPPTRLKPRDQTCVICDDASSSMSKKYFPFYLVNLEEVLTILMSSVLDRFKSIWIYFFLAIRIFFLSILWFFYKKLNYTFYNVFMIRLIFLIPFKSNTTIVIFFITNIIIVILHFFCYIVQ
jgi:hypothetical protein